MSFESKKVFDLKRTSTLRKDIDVKLLEKVSTFSSLV